MDEDAGLRRTMPELHQLAVFLNVVEAGSFTGAARRLGCSQPAVSQTIGRLAEIYGGDLFARRRGARLALTPVGKAVLPGIRRILDAVDRQMVEATDAARGRAGALSVGFCPGLFEGRFRTAIGSLIAEAPRVRLRFVEDEPAALHTALARHRLDMIVAPLAGISSDPEQESELLWNEPLVAVISDNDSRAGAMDIGPGVLGATTLRWPRAIGDSARGSLEGIDPADSRDAPQQEVLPPTIIAMVTMGLGSGVIPACAAISCPGLAFRQLNGETPVAIHANWFRDDANPLRHRFLRHLRAAALADKQSALE